MGPEAFGIAGDVLKIIYLGRVEKKAERTFIFAYSNYDENLFITYKTITSHYCAKKKNIMYLFHNFQRLKKYFHVQDSKNFNLNRLVVWNKNFLFLSENVYWLTFL